MGKGYRKSSSRSSTVLKRLPAAHLLPEVGQPLSPSPDATIMQHATSSSPEHSNKQHRAKCKEIIRGLSGEQQGYITCYEGVSLRDYSYIMDQLESVEYGKVWKLSFFPNSQLLMVSSPSFAHESVLAVVMRNLDSVLSDIPAEDTVDCQVYANSYVKGPSVWFVPDLLVLMHSDNTMCSSRPLWLMECTFTQTDRDVMRKLHAYVDDNPTLLVVCKILLKQATPYRSPGSNGSIAKELRSSRLLTPVEWRRRLGDVNDITQVIVDGHTWFSLSSVEIHLWMRRPGDSKLDIDLQEGDGYAFGTLYPTVNLSDINKAFRCGLDLVKEAVVLELNQLPDVEQATIHSVEDWTPPPCTLDQTILLKALVRGAQATAYDRYHDWHSKLQSSPYGTTRRRSQTSRTRASHRPTGHA
ncbi:hypothetical protein BKA83DRAFT_4498396 [Pisolithus microcarpus]|nr:hypothetical protein BKA83DRAFT_4498396 [Pisolithus microcarpus]